MGHYSNFPSWYFWVKWILPLGLALIASILAGMAVTGVISGLGILDSAAFVYASLEGISATAMLSFTIGVASCIVGFAAALLIRAGLLEVAEAKVVQQSQKTSQAENALSSFENMQGFANQFNVLNEAFQAATPIPEATVLPCCLTPSHSIQPSTSSSELDDLEEAPPIMTSNVRRRRA